MIGARIASVAVGAGPRPGARAGGGSSRATGSGPRAEDAPRQRGGSEPPPGVHTLLAATLTRADASIADCAATVGIGVPELRRRLAAEGTSFRQVRREAILAQARHHLERGVQSEDAAHLLGYADARSFRRAIKLAGGGRIEDVRKGSAAAGLLPRARAGGPSLPHSTVTS